VGDGTWHIDMKTTGLIVMGVAGCGKTSVGKALAERLGWVFFDGDDFHPPANVAKMASGIPLNDGDRAPWLDELHGLLARALREGHHPVLACSALKERYRRTLLEGNGGIRVVYLRGDYDLILSRMRERTDHYMKPGMLRSQFEALEEPADALTANIDRPVPQIVDGILQALRTEEG
jgi:carbohydrate kinase (thermoresistant glucokinase family)